MDQYRVTRELPLPYNIDSNVNDDGEEGEEDCECDVNADVRNSWLERQFVARDTRRKSCI
jgi:hypothetical protein